MKCKNEPSRQLGQVHSRQCRKLKAGTFLACTAKKRDRELVGDKVRETGKDQVM